MSPRRLVLIGDSIRLGYQPFVSEALQGTADVWGPDENCSSTRHILANDTRWLTTIRPGSVVHLNAGLHDLRRLPATHGEPLVPIEEYEHNLDRIVSTLIRTLGGGRVCLATSTPVDDVRHSAGRVSNRHENDVRNFNQRLVAVAERHQLALNDLHAVIGVDPRSLLGDDGVHLTAAGNRAAGRAVADVAAALLA